MKNNTKTFMGFLLIALILLGTGQRCFSQAPSDASIKQQAIRAWQDMRFGMFIHWGPVSLKGTEISWSRGRQVPIDEYDQLYKRFNPTKFNAEQWVRIAQEAGMKYLVLTTKHHDGFCLWPSKYTDYNISNTPFQRDIVRELSDACRRQGLGFGAYYSVCDWHHPDFPITSPATPAGGTVRANPNLDRYVTYERNQLTELIHNYGPLTTIWFDMPQRVYAKRGKPTEALIYQLQPSILINNRGYRDGADSGDYDTPEQRVGGFNRQQPWETCMTIGTQWAWKPNDKMKSRQECLQTLISTVGGDGNLLFNVGPMPDGRIEPRQVARLKQMGDWLEKFGEGVYGTRGGPFKPGKWGASTCKNNHIYLFVMNWPREGPLKLPALEQKILKTETLSGGQASVQQDDTGILVDLPRADRDETASVIQLTVQGNAVDIEPVEVLNPGP